MGMSRAEQRAYQRGYNRGRNRTSEWAKRLIKIAKGYRARLSDESTERRCSACARWSRGGGAPRSDICLWGVCKGGFDWSAEPRMWVHNPADRWKALEITTSEDFGCTNWLTLDTGSDHG